MRYVPTGIITVQYLVRLFSIISLGETNTPPPPTSQHQAKLKQEADRAIFFLPTQEEA
jgi:hypothetical protein